MNKYETGLKFSIPIVVVVVDVDNVDTNTPYNVEFHNPISRDEYDGWISEELLEELISEASKEDRQAILDRQIAQAEATLAELYVSRTALVKE